MQFKDQLNQTITINQPPKRIISLVPSQTELLFDLGLTDEIIGITKFCIHPKDKFKTTAKIGGTKKLNLQKIIDLKPDLIIGNKEENQKEDIEALMQLFPVWMSDIYNLEDALEMIKNVGELVNRKDEALKIAQETQANFNQLIKEISNLPKKKTLYFIWKDPYMMAGKQTFINEMLGYCNLENIITQSRYPSIEESDFNKFNPEVVLLSSEPFPFKEKHIKYFSHIWPNAAVKLIDGEMFSWYGSRLLKSAPYFQNLKQSL
jgi:ABC-type Fe3+-hydroxamate transport system substrate-binding protein